MTKTVIISILSYLVAMPTVWGALTFTGSGNKVISVTPDAYTGLEAVYVLRDFAGVTATFDNPVGTVTWYKFGNLGGGYREEIASGVTSISLSGLDDCGIIVEDGKGQHCFWLVDYSKHYLRLDGLSVSPETDCFMTPLILNGSAEKIMYYTCLGAVMNLSRELKLSYTTLAYDEESRVYNPVETEKVIEGTNGEIHVEAPLCQTIFTLSGDRFLEEWGETQSVSTSTFDADAVEATTWAEQEERKVDNEKHVDTGEALGGSAPVEINFGAAITDAVVFKEWQLSKDREFNDITTRYNDTEISLTFREQGTTYVRFMVSNAAGDCDWVSETYEVNIGESKLECPNAFSPGNGDGINDEWKVSYRSIISFECHIFNRWGQKIVTLTHPSQGWDGRYKGKLVPSGVYYYVIKAEGADGKQYKLGGDINIINFKNPSGTGASSGDAVAQ